jgi:putative transposase
MSKPTRLCLPGQCYFVTTVVKNRKDLLRDLAVCSLIIEDLKFYRKKHGFLLHGYVIMPDHLHILISAQGNATISQIMHDLKSHTAQEINLTLGRQGPFWQEGFYDHIVRDERDFQRKIDYIHKNPLRSGLAAEISDYPLSSFRNYYAEDDSMIEVDKITW